MVTPFDKDQDESSKRDLERSNSMKAVKMMLNQSNSRTISTEQKNRLLWINYKINQLFRFHFIYATIKTYCIIRFSSYARILKMFLKCQLLFLSFFFFLGRLLLLFFHLFLQFVFRFEQVQSVSCPYSWPLAHPKWMQHWLLQETSISAIIW